MLIALATQERLTLEPYTSRGFRALRTRKRHGNSDDYAEADEVKANRAAPDFFRKTGAIEGVVGGDGDKNRRTGERFGGNIRRLRV